MRPLELRAHAKRRLPRALIAAVYISALILPTAVVGATSEATEVAVLTAAGDTYLRSGAPDTNEGDSSFLRLRASGDNRALVRFDQSALQAAVGSQTLVSATLELDISENGNNWGSSGRTVSVYRLTADWAEGEGFVDQGSPPDRGTGSGATWACAIDSDISDQGKDCSGTTEWEMGQPSQAELHPWVEQATSSVLITNGLSGTVSFDVTADVQAFLAGSVPNDGWIVKKELEGPSGLVQFASRETGSGPRLVVTVEGVSQPPANTAPPVVSGASAEESTLLASTGGWSGNPTTFAYQRQRCSAYSEAVTADDPVAWWRMSETSGTELRDTSGYHNDGAYPAGATLGQPGAPIGLIGGDIDTSTVFDGSGPALVAASDTLDGLAADFAIEAWIRPSANSSTVPLVAKEAGDGSTAGDLPALLYGLVLDASGMVSLRLRLIEDGDGDGIEEGLDELPDITHDVSLQASIAAGPNGWTHLVATYDGTEMKIFVNGVVAASQAAEGVVASNPERPLTIARLESASQSYVGGMDEVALYVYSLSPSTVQEHFAAAGQGCADIVGATESEYVLAEQDQGSRVRVRVTASNSAGSAVAESMQTALVDVPLPVSDDAAPGSPAVNAPPPEVPEPPPLDLPARTAGGSAAAANPPVEVTVIQGPANEDSFRFRNRDGIWDISKTCREWSDGQGYHAVGPGYIYRMTSLVSGVLVNDEIPAKAFRGVRYGALNSVHGGLGAFGFHYARGPALHTQAGDDPTTTIVEPPVSRETDPATLVTKKVIEGRQCAAFNNGYGVYQRNWAGPVRKSNRRIDFTTTVWFKDEFEETGQGPNGKALLRVRYRYTFLPRAVQVWMSVHIYATVNGVGLPYVKEPKFVAVVSGGDFKRVAVFRDGTYIQGVMKGQPDAINPETGTGYALSTGHSPYDRRNTVQFDYANSAPVPTVVNQKLVPPAPVPANCSQAQPCFIVRMTAMTVQPNGDVLRNTAPRFWEQTRVGLDRWAALSTDSNVDDGPSERVRSYDRDTRAEGVTVCSAPVGSSPPTTEEGRSTSSSRSGTDRDGVRRWEMGGFKNSGSGLNNQNPYERAFVFFNGWEGGAGPEDCEPLQVDFSRRSGKPLEAYGAFASYSFTIPEEF